MNTSPYLFCSLVSLFGLFFLIFWLYRDYRLDALRQDLFRLRDSLFDEAAEGNISFAHPAYGILRTSMNGMARFAHRINVLNVIAVLYIYEKHEDALPESFAVRFDHSLRNLTDEQKKLARYYQRALDMIIVRHLAKSFPLLPVLMALMLYSAVKQLVVWLRRPLDQMESLTLTEMLYSGVSRLVVWLRRPLDQMESLTLAESEA